MSGDVHPQPGPGTTTFCRTTKFLYMIAESVDSKITELQATVADFDFVFIPETWLKPHIFDRGLPPGLDFSIYIRVRDTRAGGGIMLAVKNNIQSFRRPDPEYNAEVLKCELRPEKRT